VTEAERILAQKLFGVFEKLRDGDFLNSGTVKILKEKNSEFFQKRAAEEFTELTGVIDGSHRHSDDFEKDFLLESSQVFYWLALAAIVEHKSFEKFENEFGSELEKLEKLHLENRVELGKVFEEDLKECEEKGYL
jgi:hypothetical protein